MNPNITISKNTFVQILDLIMEIEKQERRYPNSITPQVSLIAQALYSKLTGVLDAKVTAAKKREAYTRSKMATAADERESARQEYLDLAGMREEYQYSQELAEAFSNGAMFDTSDRA